MNRTLEKRIEAAERARGIETEDGALALQLAAGLAAWVETGEDSAFAAAMKDAAGLSESERERVWARASKKMDLSELTHLIYAIDKVRAERADTPPEEREAAKARIAKTLDDTLGYLQGSFWGTEGGCKWLYAPREEIEAYCSSPDRDEFYTAWRLRLLLRWGLIPMARPAAANSVDSVH